ncbi:lipopolysaccharide biosynthesis protein [Helicobacter suis]|uniref:lipopolysaccharide biosynthesis protein n=1 Tax=Helicobacter suis TaxID=104628 RepID=UPI0013D605EB|nr:lipopolysaccharide biosynthesis protein [Helicobacter suis]
MQIFIVHLSDATCKKFGLEPRDISPLLKSLKHPKHEVKVFDAIYARVDPDKPTSEALHPLIKAYLQPVFVQKEIASPPLSKIIYKPTLLPY